MAPKTKELNERDTKLVQWLNEAHAKESELEVALTGHIGLTEKASYKSASSSTSRRPARSTSAASPAARSRRFL